jgi:hypothetical protein
MESYDWLSFADHVDQVCLVKMFLKYKYVGLRLTGPKKPCFSRFLHIFDTRAPITHRHSHYISNNYTRKQDFEVLFIF